MLPRPVCAPADVGIDITPDAPEPLRRLVTGHFAQFLRPEPHPAGRSVQCVCGASLTGVLVGTFRWGLAHGEGRCADCGWPARAYHYLNDAEGKVLSLTAVLLYVPLPEVAP